MAGAGVPRKESVHNRFAGRLKPMVWQPSGETRFMGWTGNHNRKSARRRQRPLLESLDDRCLLSTGAGITLTDHLAAHANFRRGAAVRHAHSDGSRGEKAGHTMGHHRSCQAAANPNGRPGSAIETGAAHNLRPHHRSVCLVPLELQCAGNRNGRCGDRHRSRLQ